MDLQLKNVKFSEFMSEETNAFTADLWFRGKKIGYTKNDGQGGCTFTWAYDGMRDQLNEAENYAKSLPAIVYKGVGGREDFSLDSNLEHVIDRLFENWLETKEIKKQEKKGIYYEKPNGQRATTYWVGWTLKDLLNNPKGRGIIANAIFKLQKEGNTILNTNLGSLLT